jgi:hypothetical protein
MQAGRKAVAQITTEDPRQMIVMKMKLCKYCGQPMKPKGVRKRPDEYDHARGCPADKKRRTK